MVCLRNPQLVRNMKILTYRYEYLQSIIILDFKSTVIVFNFNTITLWYCCDVWFFRVLLSQFKTRRALATPCHIITLLSPSRPSRVLHRFCSQVTHAFVYTKIMFNERPFGACSPPSPHPSILLSFSHSTTLESGWGWIAAGYRNWQL